MFFLKSGWILRNGFYLKFKDGYDTHRLCAERELNRLGIPFKDADKECTHKLSWVKLVTAEIMPRYSTPIIELLYRGRKAPSEAQIQLINNLADTYGLKPITAEYLDDKMHIRLEVKSNA